jgi:hypothetical protein
MELMPSAEEGVVDNRFEASFKQNQRQDYVKGLITNSCF